MKIIKVLLVLAMTVVLTGCGLFDLSSFIIPDDSEFIATVESLDTPEKACQYVMDNFEWEKHILNYSPYQVWLVNKANTGDCNDMACFLAFVTHYHGYEIYQIVTRFKGTLISHALCVFVEEEQYTYSSNQYYHPIYVDTFKEIVDHYERSLEITSYKVFDYEGNVVTD